MTYAELREVVEKATGIAGLDVDVVIHVSTENDDVILSNLDPKTLDFSSIKNSILKEVLNCMDDSLVS